MLHRRYLKKSPEPWCAKASPLKAAFALRCIALGSDLVVHQHAPFRDLAWYTFAVAPFDGESLTDHPRTIDQKSAL
jgi:hypothetical protein